MEQETPQDSQTAGKRTVKIDEDEWWPCYTIYTEDSDYNYDTEFELPVEDVKWIERVQQEFEEVQAYLGKLFRGR